MAMAAQSPVSAPAVFPNASIDRPAFAENWIASAPERTPVGDRRAATAALVIRRERLTTRIAPLSISFQRSGGTTLTQGRQPFPGPVFRTDPQNAESRSRSPGAYGWTCSPSGAFRSISSARTGRYVWPGLTFVTWAGAGAAGVRHSRRRTTVIHTTAATATMIRTSIQLSRNMIAPRFEREITSEAVRWRSGIEAAAFNAMDVSGEQQRDGLEESRAGGGQVPIFL